MSVRFGTAIPTSLNNFCNCFDTCSHFYFSWRLLYMYVHCSYNIYKPHVHVHAIPVCRLSHRISKIINYVLYM